MWSQASSERRDGLRARPRAAASAARVLAASACALTLVLGTLGGCRSTPPRSEHSPAPAAAGSADAASTTAPAAASSGSAPAGGSAAVKAAGAGSADALNAPAPRPEVPAPARSDFDRAVSLMRAGNAAEAELGFKQVALQYPQFAAPLVNLAILQRKDGELAAAEDTLKSAVAREGSSAVAWTELGATQRMRGEFTQAAASYEQAIAADPRYAAAWRNLGVVEDLYLGDPDRALKAFEQYKQLTGEEKPVNGWIAELRQRLGVAPAKRPAEAAPQPNAAPGGGDAPAQPVPPDSQDSQDSQAPANAAAEAAPPREGG